MSNSPTAKPAAAGGDPRELTLEAVGLGLVLVLILGAANVYLGLKVGMTVSASIPAAVISMGILRGLLRRGSILENNIVQTLASAGESLAAGVIFTIPALVIAGAWTDFRYWPTTLIAALGGTLGVLFMIPLRRALIIEEEELTYPEGVACAEVLEAGERGGRSIFVVAGALLAGLLAKAGLAGVTIFRESLAWGFSMAGLVGGIGLDVSPALVSVGFIVGLEIAVLIFLGGALGWLVAMPILSTFVPLPVADGGGTLAPLDACWYLWKEHVRFIGVGAMVVGGLASIVKVRKGIAKGLRSVAATAGTTAEERSASPREDRDLGLTAIGGGVALCTLLIGGLYVHLIGSVPHGVFTTVLMVITAFFFVAVSSYICGLVGSSNNPVSGMTICTVLFAGGLMALIGMSGMEGIIATLCVAGVVCCAACTAGDCSQDLKTGYIVGATPRNQQIAELIGVLAAAFVMAPVLGLLHQAYGIGSKDLLAPQATLFAKLAQAIVGEGTLPWSLIVAGVLLGVAILAADAALEKRRSSFRLHLMPVAVGIYLPVMMALPILLGGLVQWAVKRSVSAKDPAAAREATHQGVLIASGLIAGEAVAGILLAGVIVSGVALPFHLLPEEGLAMDLASAALIGALMAAIYVLSKPSEPE